MLLLGLILTLGWAAPPLILTRDVGGAGMQAWFKPGDLLVGTPNIAGRPGMRPLISDAQMVLPVDLEGWTPIGDTCQDPPRATNTINNVQVTATVTVDPTGHQIARLRAGDLILAEGAFTRPAQICALVLAEVDPLPGMELLIAWRLGDKPDDLRGLTVYRVPETARY